MSRTPDQISKKKQELESNLARIQKGLDKSIEDVRGEVAQNLSPAEVVKKYPLPVVGGAILLGFLLGNPGRSRKRGASSNSITGTIGESIKKRVTRKAVDMALDILEEKVNSSKGKDKAE